jgi:hypothetical protein
MLKRMAGLLLTTLIGSLPSGAQWFSSSIEDLISHKIEGLDRLSFEFSEPVGFVPIYKKIQKIAPVVNKLFGKLYKQAYLVLKQMEWFCNPSLDSFEMTIAIDPEGIQANVQFELQVSAGLKPRHTHQIKLSLPFCYQTQNKNFIPSSITRAS